MKLYSGPLSLFTAKVRIALEEKEIPYELISVLFSSTDGYRRLAAQAGLAPGLQRDVTAQTMPTYRFLRILDRLARTPWSARIQTLLLEGLTRVHFLRYLILSFAAGGHEVR